MSKDKNKKKGAIGTRLRLARDMAGLSQAQVAKMLSLHRPSVSEIEAGRRKVSAEELSKLAEIYDVKLNWLMGLDTGENNKENEKIKLAARQLAKLKPKDYERVIHLLSILRSNKRERK